MTDEDAELQAKIARLTNRINQAKAAESASQTPRHAPKYWPQQRGTPYGAYRGRGGSFRTPHRNRTLVVNHSSSPSNLHNDETSGQTADAQSGGWVTKRDRHMQLINTSVLEQKTQQRAKAMEETRAIRRQQRDEQEKNAVLEHVRRVNDANVSVNAQGPQILMIEGVKFVVVAGGSKLIKSKDEINLGKATPKQVFVSGVSFVRSKHGNLYRAGFVKTQRSEDQPFYSFGDSTNAAHRRPIKSKELCQRFCSTGACSKGPMCKFTHDPAKVAVCRDFLTTGKCEAGDHCDLSHDLIPERIPLCVHFQRGACTNESCPYAHVKMDSATPVCRSFATLGYCSSGSSCTERHNRECPDFTNTGSCSNKKCKLPHIHRAGHLRKNGQNKEDEQDQEAKSDYSSDEDEALDDNDFDSDDFEDTLTVESNEHQLAGQDDYVHF